MREIIADSSVVSYGNRKLKHFTIRGASGR
jgi:hypothetical protein